MVSGAAAVGVGGSGGGAGNGRSVDLTYGGGSIRTGLANGTTQAVDGEQQTVNVDFSPGILAQSIGGGGGAEALRQQPVQPLGSRWSKRQLRHWRKRWKRRWIWRRHRQRQP